MYKLCKTEQSAQRQHDLENGLLEAMLTKNYEDISISDLCDHLQIPRKSFYRYFSSKDGAFHALLDHTLQECSSATPATNDSLQYFEQYFIFWLSKKKLLDALERSGLSGKLVERTINGALQDRDFTSHLVRRFPDMNRHHAALFLISGLMALMIQWHHSGCKESPYDMALTVSQLLTDPFFSR